MSIFSDFIKEFINSFDDSVVIKISGLRDIDPEKLCDCDDKQSCESDNDIDVKPTKADIDYCNKLKDDLIQYIENIGTPIIREALNSFDEEFQNDFRENVPFMTDPVMLNAYITRLQRAVDGILIHKINKLKSLIVNQEYLNRV